MPLKTKKDLSSDTTKSTPSKKFIVEEKSSSLTEEKPKTELKPQPDIQINTLPSVSSDSDILPLATVETETNISEKLPTDTPLNSKSEKDTMSSPNITSFSLLDSDKKDVIEDKTMNLNTNQTETGKEVSPALTPDQSVKSSQDDVNKWIENYDEKETSSKKKGAGGFKVFLIILTVLSFLALVAGGIYYYQKNISGSDEGEKNSDKTEEVSEPEPTLIPTKAPEKEAVEVDYQEYSLQILNGSGIPGEAGKVKDLISSLEFDSVLTGNASSFDVTKTTISLKKDVPNQVFEDVKELLEKQYDMDLETVTLQETSKYDVIITVGLKK